MLKVDENIVTRIFLTQNFANEINANYGIRTCTYKSREGKGEGEGERGGGREEREG